MKASASSKKSVRESMKSRLVDRAAMPWLGYACGTCEYCVSGSDLAQDRAVLAPVEVLDDRVGTDVVVHGLARREIESATAGVSDAPFRVFDYLRDVTIVAIHFWLET